MQIAKRLYGRLLIGDHGLPFSWPLRTDHCSLTTVLVAGVIWVACEDCKCTVELLGEHQAGECMGKGKGAEGKQELSVAASGLRPAVSRADGEDHMLRALIPVPTQPGSKRFGGHLAAATIEQDRDNGGAMLL